MKTASIKHQITVIKPTEKAVIRIQLADDCRNGHEHFSITADIYDKTPRGWRESGGGCCHEHILKLRPALAPFVVLHLSDQDGIPVHAIANGIYWINGAAAVPTKYGPDQTPAECARIAADHLRATPEEIATMVATVRTEAELSEWLETHGFRARWKAEAQAAIRQLEAWTGQTFESAATRPTWQPLTAEEREAAATLAAIPPEVRDAQKAAAMREARKTAILERHTKETTDANNERDLALALLDVPEELANNVILYDHTATITANWKDFGRKWTGYEWAAWVVGCGLSGFKFEIK